MAGEEKEDAVATALALEGVALGVEGMQIGGDERASSETQPALTPPRTTSGSGSGSGSSGRTRLTRAQREAQNLPPTPKDSKEYKEERTAALLELKQVNE